jgi:two-component system NtrC family sensor kinase
MTDTPNDVATNLQQTIAELQYKLAECTAERNEALERQTATTDILKVIAGSPSDVQPVFEAIAVSANRLIGGFSATVMLFIGDMLHLVALTSTNAAADQTLKASFPRPLAEFPPFELVRGGETVQFPDTEAEGVPAVNRQLARLRGYRSMLFTPLMSNGAPVGILSVTRARTGTFPAHHVELLRTFADQAVIAIENARLFEEVQAKTRDLMESLEQQTATSEVLSVMSRSPRDAQPVFEAIAKSAALLCEAILSNVQLFDGELLHIAATYNFNSEVLQQFYDMYPRRPDHTQIGGRAVLSRGVVHIPDLLEDPDYPRELAISGNWRAIMAVPMLRDGRPIGVIAVAKGDPVPSLTGKWPCCRRLPNRQSSRLGT